MPQADKIQTTCPKGLVSLGSNATSTTRESAKIIHDAVDFIAQSNLRITKISDFYKTPCFPPGAGPDFVNAAIEVQTDLLPHDLLQFLHETEVRFGRERPSRWAPRTLDMDLIACGDVVLPDRALLQHWMDMPLEDQKKLAPEQLILPHPRVQDRAFVLIPLADIAPDWRHPIIGKTVREMVAALPDAEKKGVQPYVAP
ncbi:2-amino-4-hydroxy-6-hydroxymethyldihydropteridine diphosphokinase [Aliiroseovarius sediminis]|uniref:2-amino-4-hydroxy-6- hydroxymethyldihydropteridine diphosphokinase n=1 Tax=Aliiroseovarius sediminis TaxID=2925839 RepID=UPI001F571139|nr:2-amino-4-hydroxy-6-hydroxymethyldihydropteridine diphosphokinase [Aliiroseovarius sediminis]MCI2395828.1 2-amino-4-hydroxy-6-hydroxymethyldihydropteridine diphosphokinase [Aliiroseovarius sediminis]